MSLNKIAEILTKHGIETSVAGSELAIQHESHTLKVPINDEWKKAIDLFFKKKIYDYTPTKRILRKKNYAEFQIIRLDPKYYIGEDYTFTSDTSETVLIGSASKEYILAFIESTDLDRYIPLIKRRIERRAVRARIRFEDLIPIGRQKTAVFKRQGKYLSDEFIERAKDRIRACLFHLAFTQGECWELRESVSDRSTRLPVEAETEEAEDTKIPLGSYSSDAISFYKVAKSSIFPSQTYLSFYHVLEYFFLKR